MGLSERVGRKYLVLTRLRRPPGSVGCSWVLEESPRKEGQESRVLIGVSDDKEQGSGLSRDTDQKYRGPVPGPDPSVLDSGSLQTEGLGTDFVTSLFHLHVSPEWRAGVTGEEGSLDSDGSPSTFQRPLSTGDSCRGRRTERREGSPGHPIPTPTPSLVPPVSLSSPYRLKRPKSYTHCETPTNTRR